MPDKAGSSPDDRSTEVLAGLEIVNTHGLHKPKPLSELRHQWRTRATVPVHTDFEERQPKPARPAIVALPSLVLLAVVSAFFCWVSVEPSLMAMGRTVDGEVTVTRCLEAGACEGDFRPNSGGDTLPGVRVTGDTDVKRSGESWNARAASASASTVYVGSDAGLWWRGGTGLTMVLSCGFAIAWVTGAWRWRGEARFWTVAASIGAPLALWLANLVLAW